MSFMSFQGRIGRGMWWLTGLVQLLLVAGAIAYVAAVDAAEDPRTGWQGPVFFAIVLFGSWIGLCANIKRYHDRGKSGLWVLICFVPLIGPIWMFIELGFLPGTAGDNTFGPLPTSGAGLPGSTPAAAPDAPVGTSSLAKLDDAYFRDYAANKAAVAKTNSKPSGTRDGRASKGGFGKRGLASPA